MQGAITIFKVVLVQYINASATTVFKVAYLYNI